MYAILPLNGLHPVFWEVVFVNQIFTLLSNIKIYIIFLNKCLNAYAITADMLIWTCVVVYK